MKAYIQTYCERPDGTRDSFATIDVDIKEKPLDWQTRGLSYTATGYGRKIPTRYMVKFNDKWRRVYCCIISNIGTCYIGDLKDNLIVQYD